MIARGYNVAGAVNFSSTLVVGTSITTTAGTITANSAIQSTLQGIYTGASSSGLGAAHRLFTNDGAAMSSNDRLGMVDFGGNDGTGNQITTQIMGRATETFSNTAHGSKIEFYTTPNGATTVILALTLGQDQSATFVGDVSFPTSKKLGFFGATPVVRDATGFTQTFSATSHTNPNMTAVNPPAGGTGTAAGGWDTAANRNLAITSLTNVIADVSSIKQFVNALVDTLQSYGIAA